MTPGTSITIKGPRAFIAQVTALLDGLEPQQGSSLSRTTRELPPDPTLGLSYLEKQVLVHTIRCRKLPPKKVKPVRT